MLIIIVAFRSIWLEVGLRFRFDSSWMEYEIIRGHLTTIHCGDSTESLLSFISRYEYRKLL